jgi:hypothetical protein
LKREKRLEKEKLAGAGRSAPSNSSKSDPSVPPEREQLGKNWTVKSCSVWASLACILVAERSAF